MAVCLLPFGSRATPAQAADASIPTVALIEEINLHGTFPLLDRQIRRQLSIRPGDRYLPDQLPEQLERLQTYYERQGYYGSTFTWDARWREYSQGVQIDLHIARGRSFRWGAVSLAGNSLLRTDRIASHFSHFGYYTPRALRDRVRELMQVYRMHGYPKARVRVLGITPRFETGRMDVALEVTEGPRLELRFDGNEHVRDGELAGVVTFYEEGRIDPFAIEQSVQAMRQRYIERGYLDSRIHGRRETVAPNVERITFTIAEGERRTIWSVDFTGNAARSDGALRERILTQPLAFLQRGTLDPSVLAEDREALREYYEREGFLDAAIDQPLVTDHLPYPALDVTFPVTEGDQYFIGTVTFAGNIHATHEQLLQRLTLTAGRPMNPTQLETDRQTAQLYFDDHGYPYATVGQRVTKDTSRHLVHLHYDVIEGPLVHIGQITIAGDFITSQRAIREALAVDEGGIYSDRLILDSQQNLRRLGAFRTVTIERRGLQERATTIDLDVRVEEEKPFIVEAELGYATDTKLSGSLQFTNINAFGWAKRTQLLLLGGQRRARAELGWIDPRFFSTDLLFTAKGWIDRNQDIAFDLVQAGGSIGLYRQYHRTGFVARYQMTRNRLLNGDSTTADAEGRRNTIMSQLTGGVTFDTRNNFSNPTRGVYLYAEADLFNELKGPRADFVRVRGAAAHYWDLWHGLVLSQTGRVGSIHSIREASIPITERFFFGGDDTLRGFDEDRVGPLDANGDPLGGTVRWIYNAELTAPLFDGFRAAAFFDIGSLTNAYSAINRDAIRESVGFGLRYVTPIGPLRAEYAVKLDRRPDESSGRFHFTFGHVF